MLNIKDISPDKAFVTVVASLISASIFFTVNVELRRGALGFWLAQEVELEDGQRVELHEVIDGDEVSVRVGDDPLVVRLLGIKAFSPNVNEPGISAFGQQAKTRLRSILGGSKALTLRFTASKSDNHGRVLAYIHADTTDVGQALVEAGLALSYNAYAFDREQSYAAAENVAKTRKEGLWGDSRVVERANALKAAWAARRKGDEG